MGESDKLTRSQLAKAHSRRLLLFALACGAWLASFAVLAQKGTWVPFALVGPVLVLLALGLHAVPVALLRPSLGRIGLGLGAGLLMVLLTHAAYAIVATVLPAARRATTELWGFLNVGGFSPAARAGLIGLIASCEEVLFRGPLPGAPAQAKEDRLRPMSRGDLVPVVALAVAYALAALPLGSALLVLCAFLCGLVWGVLRVVTGSLVVPILTHVSWDLGVLVVWPLVASP